MKKFLSILLSAVCICGILTACGSKSAQGSSSQSENTSADSALTPQDDDTMHLNMLFSLMNTPDRGVKELLGEGTEQKYRADGSLWRRKYDGIVYGTEITFVVTFDEFNDVALIDIQFDDSISEEQLSAAISELTGREPSNNVWHAENAIVSLEKSKDGLYVTLSPFTAETDSDNIQQY